MKQILNSRAHSRQREKHMDNLKKLFLTPHNILLALDNKPPICSPFTDYFFVLKVVFTRETYQRSHINSVAQYFRRAS